MALIKCKECGSSISDKAGQCPHCGIHFESRFAEKVRLGIIFVIILVALFSLFGIQSNKDIVKSHKKTENISFDRSAEAQSVRLAFINKLIENNIIYKIKQPAELPHIYIGPSFKHLPYEDKKAFMQIVYTYYYAQNSKADIAILKDYQTGKEVGNITKTGLSLD